MARRYEFYFPVAKQYFTHSLRSFVKYCFCHEKIKFIFSSRRVMFFLLYRHADDGVFDDFPKISEDFPKLFRRPDERLRTFFENFRRFPKISDDCRRLSRKTRRCFDNTPTNLRWPTTVFARALADAIQRAHKDSKNKHAVDTAIILFAQCALYLCYFSS